MAPAKAQLQDELWPGFELRKGGAVELIKTIIAAVGNQLHRETLPETGSTMK
jgi:hypothetical protein